MKNHKSKSAACILTGLISLSLTFGTQSPNQRSVFAESPSEPLISAAEINGDVNADGSFNIADVVLFQKWLLAVPDTHLADWKSGDLCEDDRLDIFDYVLMKQLLFIQQ